MSDMSPVAADDQDVLITRVFDAPRDQPRAFEHLEVARDRGLRHGERRRQLHHRRLPAGEAGQDGPARGIGQGGEGGVEGGHVGAGSI